MKDETTKWFLVILFVVCFMALSHSIQKDISERGLKNIVNELWEGKSDK